MDMFTKTPSLQILDKVTSSMPEKEQRVIRAMMKGHTQLEISQFAGTPQTVIRYYLKSFQIKVMKELEIGSHKDIVS